MLAVMARTAVAAKLKSRKVITHSALGGARCRKLASGRGYAKRICVGGGPSCSAKQLQRDAFANRSATSGSRPGEHILRVHATDDRGDTQPDASACTELGYLQHSVLLHPLRVEHAPTPRIPQMVGAHSAFLAEGVTRVLLRRRGYRWHVHRLRSR